MAGCVLGTDVCHWMFKTFVVNMIQGQVSGLFVCFLEVTCQIPKLYSLLTLTYNTCISILNFQHQFIISLSFRFKSGIVEFVSTLMPWLHSVRKDTLCAINGKNNQLSFCDNLCRWQIFIFFHCFVVVVVFLVQVRLRIEVLHTPNWTRLGFRTHNLQIMMVHFMSLRCLL